jgi:hypothetical protein
MRFLYALLLTAICSVPAVADPVIWASWTGIGANTVTGTLNGSPITFTGPTSFAQINGVGTNYWVPSAPYLSATISNPPPDADIIALENATGFTITFNTPVTNLVMGIVSLNGGNTYEFDQDFTVLSDGCGYWGCGVLTNSGSNLNGGDTLSTTGEGHGAIEFAGTISTLTWDSTVAENWNGFTVGEVIPAVPEPSSLSLLGTGLGVVGMLVRRRFRRA